LEKVFQPLAAEIIPAEEEYIHQYLEQPCQPTSPIQPFTMDEIIQVIKYEVNSKKAPGYELISGKVIKQLPPKALQLIRIIFNTIVRLEQFPSQWKISQIILIPKPGKPADEITSYGSISLLPILSKVFEKLFLKRLTPLLEECN